MKIVVVGGCGHVGLPLAVSLAESGAQVTSYDINNSAVELVKSGSAPFYEESLDHAIQRNIDKNFFVTNNPKSISVADVVVMIVGTPLDTHLNPDPNAVVEAIFEIKQFLNRNQLLILRSTVFPGVTKRVEAMLSAEEINLQIAFCPERIVEGAAMAELRTLPQIVGVRDDQTFLRAKNLFDLLGVDSIRTTPEEAELAKLFTNTWRYIKFAAANQFWMLSNDFGVEYEKVRFAIRFDYPRASDLPGAGFAAGPCLFKDTMQLASFSGNNFPLGNAAMLINEGQPNYIVDKLRSKYNLEKMRVGILGMAFKAESDDPRSSLAYKLKNILNFYCLEVLTSDPFVKGDSSLICEDQLLERADLIILAAPHKRYREIISEKPFVDIWNLRDMGTIV